MPQSKRRGTVRPRKGDESENESGGERSTSRLCLRKCPLNRYLAGARTWKGVPVKLLVAASNEGVPNPMMDTP
jgi:hypothetical protein